MKKGIELFEMIEKILAVVILVIFVLSFLIPQGRILFMVSFVVYFSYPIIEQILYYYHKWLYRNIEVAEFFLDEDVDTWEKTTWRIIKVISFKMLNEIVHQKYLEDIEANYKRLLTDKSIKDLNRFLYIDKEANIPYIKRKDFIKLEEPEVIPKKEIEYTEEKYDDKEDIEGLEEIEEDEEPLYLLYDDYKKFINI